MKAGIDLGGTKIQAVVVDDAHAVAGQARLPTPRSGGPEDVAEAMAEAVRQSAAQAGADTAELAGIGVGSPGVIDARRGTVSSARNLPRWEGTFALGKALSAALGPRKRADRQRRQRGHRGRVRARRRARLPLAAGRVLGHGRGRRDHPARPHLARARRRGRDRAHGRATSDGARCPCGRRGCVEAYAGRGALEERARHRQDKGHKTELFKIMEKRGRDRLTSGIWARALEADDKLAHKLLEEAVEALGAGVASALNVLDVDAVVLGGGLGLRLGEPYREKIEKAMLPHLFASENPPPFVLAELGDLGGAIGASLLIKS